MKFRDFLILLLVVAASFIVAKYTSLGPWVKDQLMPPLEDKTVSAMKGDIKDYFLDDVYLDRLVDRWYDSLSPTARAGQLIMPAWDKTLDFEALQTLLENETVGGFMILTEDFTAEQIADLKRSNANEVPLLVAIDAEPSLLKYRFAEPVFAEETADLNTTKKITDTTKKIADELKSLGVNLNFAPVYDLGLNKTVIGPRAFSEDPDIVITQANQMSRGFMNQGIIPTAKHFPGHGLVAGDTHLEAQTITAPLTEIPQFLAAIKAQVPVMMVGHLTVKNDAYDTLGLPATLSGLMMQDLLRQRLGFTGVIVTDAMNMEALSGFEAADLNALQAGADIILMPQDAAALNQQIVELFGRSADSALRLEQKVKRVLRLKLVQRLSVY